LVEKRRATHKKITLSAPCRKQQRKNAKSQVQVYLQPWVLLFLQWFFVRRLKKGKKWRIRLRPFGLRRDKERGIRHERSEVSLTCEALSGNPQKNHAFCTCRKQQRKNEKSQWQVYLQPWDLLFLQWFFVHRLEKGKKMAEREGFKPSIILLVKSRLKRCFIPPFERKFLKF